MSNTDNSTPAEILSLEQAFIETYNGARKLGFDIFAAMSIARIWVNTIVARRALRDDSRGD